MSDKNFQIRLNVKVDETQASKELESIKSKLETKSGKNPLQLKLKLTDKEIASQIKEIQTALNNAFKLDESQLSNIKELKETLQQINQLSKKASNAFFKKLTANTKESNSQTKKLTKQYEQLISKQKSLETQMSKTTNMQSYEALNKKLKETQSELKRVGKDLDDVAKKGKSKDITQSLATTFQTVQKDVTNTIRSIDKLFQGNALNTDQWLNLTKMKKQLEGLQNVKLDKILNAEKPYGEMSSLVSVASLLKSEVADVRLNVNFNNEIETSKKKIQNLIADFKNLRSKDFIDKKSVDNSVASLEQLEKEFDQLTNKYSVSGTQMEDLRRRLEALGKEYVETNQKAKSTKADYKFNIDVDKAMSELASLKQRIESVGGDTAEVDVLINKLNALGKVSTDKAVIDLRTLKNEISEFSKITNANLQTSSSLSKESEIRNLINLYNKLKNEEKSLKTQMAKTTNTQSYEVLEKELAQVEKNVRRVTKSLKNLGQTNLGKINISRSLTQDFQSFQKEIDSTTRKINDMLKNKNLDSGMVSSLEKIKAELQSLKSVNLAGILKTRKPYEEMSKLSAKAEELRADLMNLDINIKFSGNIKQLGTDVDNLSNKLKTLGKSDFVDSNALNVLHERVKQIKAELQNIDPNTENAKAEFERLQMEMKECTDAYERMVSQMRQSKADFTFQTNLEKTKADIDQLRQKLQNLGRSTSEVDRIENELKQLGNVSTDKTVAELQRLKSQLSTVSKTATGTVRSTNALQGAFQRFKSTISTYSFAHILSNQIQRGVYSIGQTILDLDSAYRDLMKVAPEGFQGTADQLDEVRRKAISTGQEVARSAVDIINSTASALQTGIDNVDQAMQYARGVNLFANVSDQEEDVADKQVKAILSAYGGIDKAMKTNAQGIKGLNKEYTEMTSVLDAMNYAGNNYAVTSADVAQGLSKFASVAKASGAEAYQAMSYVVGANETVQNASKVGTAMKTIISRMDGLQASAKDGSIYTNKTALALKTIAGINILDKNGELKDFNDLIKEVGEKWETLGKNEKKTIAEAVAGRNQLNVFQAMMDNWKTVLKYQNEYEQGFMMGSAEKENARFIDSLEGRIIKFKEELKELVTTVVSSDIAKSFISMATDVVSAINDIVKALDDAGVSMPVLFGVMTTGMNSINQMANNGKVVPFWTSFTSGVNNASNAVDNMNSNVVVATNNNQQLGNVIQSTNNQAKQSKGILGGVRTALGGFANSSFASTMKTVALSTGISILNGVLISLASVAITKAVKGLYEFANASKIAMEEHAEKADEIQNKISELGNKKQGLKAIQEEYEKLAKKTKKTSDEQERYNELRNQIAELAPDLVVGFDEENNAIIDATHSLDHYIEKLDEAIAKEREKKRQEENRSAREAIDYGNESEWNEAKGAKSYRRVEEGLKAYDEEAKKINASGQKVTDAMENYAVNSESTFKDSVNKIKEARDAHNEQIEESYEKVVEAQEKANEIIENGGRTLARNKFEVNHHIKDADEKVSTFGQSLINAFNFSDLNESDVSKFVRNFAKNLTDGNGIDEVFVKYQNLRAELQKTGDTFTYQEKVKELIPTMADLLNMDEDLVASMLELDSAQLQAKDSLDAYLQSFGKRSGMEKYDVETQDLIKQYETFNSLIEDFDNLNPTEDGNGKVTFEIEAITEIVNENDLPEQVDNLYSQLIEDGEFDQTDYEVMMKISTAMTTDDREQRKQLLSQAQELIDELFPNNSINIGDLDAQAEFILEEKSKDDLAKQIAEISDEEFAIKVRSHIENTQDAEKFQSILTDLGGKKKDIKFFIESEMENLDGMESYQDVVKWLLDRPDIQTKYHISVIGEETVDTVKESLKGLGLNKEEKKKISVAVESGNVDQLKETIDELPEEKRGEVIYNIAQALMGLDTVDGIALKDKFFEVFLGDNASAKLREIERKKLKEKVVKILAKDYASDVIDDLDLHTVYKYVKIEYQGTQLGMGGSRKGETRSSVGTFTNVSDSPMVASEDITAQSGMFSNIGDLPTATTGVSSGGGLQRTGDVNALAKKSKYVPPAIDDLFTNATKKTKIKVDYSNVWKSIKYGVELFQELENRITRVNNNLDLLDSKMDGAMGTKKISYLQAQVKLYKEQVKLQKQYYSSLQKEKSILVTKLKKQGFTVNSQGNLTSYEEKLIKLEKAYADAQKKADDYDVYSGKSESKKKASEKKKKNLEKSAEKAKKALDDANATTSRYLELLNTEIPNAKKEWEDMTNAIKQANDEIERLKFEDNIYREEHAIESVNVKLERLATLTDRARIQAERYNGDKKIKYLNKESEYLKEQLKLNEQLVKQNSAEKEDYRYKLRQYGVKFDDQGNISNYGTTLNKYQNKEDYEKVKQYMDEFNDLAEAQRQAQNEVESLTNEIIELGYEIENIKVENKMKPLEIELQNSEAYAKKLANSLELVEMQIERAYGKDKLELIKKQVELNEELAKVRRGDVLTLKEERNVLQDSLEKYGFQFTTKGDIKNVSKILDLLSDTPAYDHVAQLVEDWRTLHEDEIPDAEKAVADFEEAVKQAYDSQLDITTEIEDKITEMIEDQIDKRKEAIEKQSEAVVEALEKERDAYKALREEADYQNDYKEKVDELSEIAEQLEIARKDTSLSNRKKIKDLEKQLEEAQKELEDFVQDKIDSDVDKAYEDKIDAIEEESDKQIEALEDAWTESAIAQAVREALDTGIFTDLDGNIRNLNDAMLEFAQNSADHFSVMGQVIENDLIANLNVALDTVSNLSAIMNGLGIPEIKTAPNISNATMGTKNLTVNGITINVPTTQGVDPATIASEVQRAVEDALKNVTEGL